MIKPQDCVILLKLIANLDKDWSQRELAQRLCMSQSEVHAGLKRLFQSNLVRQKDNRSLPYPILATASEFLIHGVKYAFPPNIGVITRGISTNIAAPVFEGKLILGNEPLPVWPYAEGTARGIGFEPLYSSVPKSIVEHPDQRFYDLIALVDIIRHGRAREVNIATKMLKEALAYDKNGTPRKGS